MKKLPLSFYQQDDVIRLSQELLGKFLFTNFDEQLTGGMIVETEAYHGAEDRASHAFGMRRTKRTETNFRQGGYGYVYLCYGLHSLFNIVTNEIDIPHAVLIRAIEPTDGIDIMLKRRGRNKIDRALTAGPGALTQALGIQLIHNGISMLGPNLWIEDRGIQIDPDNIIASPRVGVDYAGDDATLPWRFRIKNNPWTSRAK
jgi:DNA-3-methyladenine glycosylase